MTISREVHRSLHVASKEPGHEAITRDTVAGSGEQSPMGMEVMRPKRDNRPVISLCASLPEWETREAQVREDVRVTPR